MTVADDFIDEVMRRSYSVRDRLKADPTVGPFIDADLPIPRPFVGAGPIKLVIVGQDPTVGSRRTRRRVTHALMLNEVGRLSEFLRGAAGALGLSLADHVYATNLCKCFFTSPPTKIKAVDLVQETGAEWLPILLDELAQFPDASVLTLGEPVIGVLLRQTALRDLRGYWGYTPEWQTGKVETLRLVRPSDTTTGRAFYPFIHLNSDKGFYKARLDDYLRFICQDIESRGIGPVEALVRS